MLTLLDVVLPHRCLACGADTAGPGCCPDCLTDLPRHPNQCPRCGVPLEVAGPCGRCQRRPPPMAETIAPFRYAPPISRHIHGLKYRHKLACGRDLGILLARELALRVNSPPDVLVPVPLHWKRRFRRGFNQSMEIARPVAQTLGIPVDTGLIRRCIHTPPQVGLTPKQRRTNTRRVFEAAGYGMPDSVALLDDVVTSGSTVMEAAACLRRAGADRVVVWAVARA